MGRGVSVGSWALVGALLLTVGVWGDDGKPPAEERIAGPGRLALVVRMQGPYDADVPLQVVCYFRHKPAGDITKGAPVELDKRLGGVIADLRQKGGFVGDELETLVLETRGKIKAKRLLLIGLGDEASLSLEGMERIGRTAYREAAKLGATRVAFAPLIRDQGNDTLSAGEVARRVVRGLLRARETDLKLQAEGLTGPYVLEEWVEEAGPMFYAETIAGVKAGLSDTKTQASTPAK